MVILNPVELAEVRRGASKGESRDWDKATINAALQAIEDLIKELSTQVTIVIVTHNMQQAGRIADYAAVLMAGEERVGRLIEYGTNNQIFDTPRDPRTEAYVTGRIG